MHKTEISAKILKSKKKTVIIIILDFAEEAEKRQENLTGKFFSVNMHTANI